MTSAGVRLLATRIAPPLAMVAALLLLAATIAYWAWRWLAPAPIHVVAVPQRDPIAAIAASGFMASAPMPVDNGAAPATLAGDVRLLGTFAEPGGGGYALFRLPSGPRLVRDGGEIASGSVLVAVMPQSIRIRDGAGERTLLLRAVAPVASAGVPRADVAPKRPAACAPPPGFRSIVVRLNAELLQGLVATPDALRSIVAPVAGGGMSVREGSGFAQMIGMKPGDRVRLANGIPLASADDVMAAVISPLMANQPVRLSGTRAGEAREMLLLNAGACPG